MAYPITLNGRTYTLADFEGQNYVDGLPDAFEDFVTHAGNLYSTTSTSSTVIGTGSKTFTVESSKPYQVGTPLRITDSAAPSTNWMDGIVTAYSGTTLTVDVVSYAGSGTKTSWNINIGGGATSYTGTLPVAQGGTGATTASNARTNLDVYSKSEADNRYVNISGEVSDFSLNGNNPSISFNDSNSSNSTKIITDDQSLRFEVDNDDVVSTSLMKFRVDGSTMMTITGTPNVGINEENPTAHLHITDNTNGAVIRLQGNGNNADGTLLGALSYWNNDGSNDTPGDVAAIRVFSTSSNGTGGEMRFYTHDGTEGGEGSDPVDRMVIGATGVVGIGETQPDSSYKLELRKDADGNTTPISIANKDTTAGTNQAVSLDFGLSRNSGAHKPNAGRIEVGRRADWTSDDVNVDAELRFHAYSDNALEHIMTMQGNGRVGINNTNPQYDLHISNDSGATLRIDTNLAAENAQLVVAESSGNSGSNGAMFRYDGGANRLDIGCGTNWNTVRISVDRDTGAVTMPYQPMFRAYPSGDSTIGNVQDTFIDLQIFGIVADNRGNHFSGATDKFTAPVDGNYYFTAQIREEVYYGSWGDIELALTKNSTGDGTGSIVARVRRYQGVQNEETVQVSALINLSANDTINVQVKTDSSSTGLSVEGSFTTFFTGHLVG
jgi:hypothetical protein